MTVDESSNRPILKVFNLNDEIVEEEDISKKSKGKNYLILRNKKTNKVCVFKNNYFFLDSNEEVSVVLPCWYLFFCV